MEGYEMLQVGWLSILPPLLAIILALLTKEVYSSLLIGVASGLVIYSCSAGTGVMEGLFMVPKMMAEQIGGNGFMILFLSLLALWSLWSPWPGDRGPTGTGPAKDQVPRRSQDLYGRSGLPDLYRRLF